jgi:hypothetical protein
LRLLINQVCKKKEGVKVKNNTIAIVLLIIAYCQIVNAVNVKADSLRYLVGRLNVQVVMSAVSYNRTYDYTFTSKVKYKGNSLKEQEKIENFRIDKTGADPVTRYNRVNYSALVFSGNDVIQPQEIERENIEINISELYKLNNK